MQTDQLPEVIASNVGAGFAEPSHANQVVGSGVQPREVVLSYEFPDLVDRIQKELNMPADEAHTLFKDMLRFLYVCASNRGERPPLLSAAIHRRGVAHLLAVHPRVRRFLPIPLRNFHPPFSGNSFESRETQIHSKESGVPHCS